MRQLDSNEGGVGCPSRQLESTLADPCLLPHDLCLRILASGSLPQDPGFRILHAWRVVRDLGLLPDMADQHEMLTGASRQSVWRRVRQMSSYGR